MKRLFLPVVLLVLSFSIAKSQSPAAAATTPVGFNTLVIPGKTTSDKAFKTISLNMMRPVVFQSKISMVSVANGQTTLTFSGSNFSDTQFIGAGNTHFLELRNGAEAGLLSDVVSNSASSVTVADDLSSAIVAGQTIAAIRPDWTFATAFGASNPFGFKSATTASQADVIQLLNPVTGSLVSYFFHATNQRWQTGGTSANDVSISPDAGLLVERKLPDPISVKLVGDVKTGPTGLFVEGGAGIHSSLVANPYPLDSKIFAESNLYTGNPQTGVFAAATASSADTASVLDPATGALTNYFYSSSNNRWQKGGVSASNDVIPSGAAVMITRKGGRAAFVWFAPQPPMNLQP